MNPNLTPANFTNPKRTAHSLKTAKRRARLLPDNFGNIQTVRGKYKKERRCWQVQVAATRAAERRRWMDDSAQEVQKQKVA
jgi:hypothetical protein